MQKDFLHFCRLRALAVQHPPLLILAAAHPPTRLPSPSRQHPPPATFVETMYHLVNPFAFRDALRQMDESDLIPGHHEMLKMTELAASLSTNGRHLEAARLLDNSVQRLGDGRLVVWAETDASRKRRVGWLQLYGIDSLVYSLCENQAHDRAEYTLRGFVDDVCKSIFGDDHEITLTAISRLGSMLCGNRKQAEVKSLYRAHLPTMRRVLGDHHIQTLQCVCNLASTLTRDDGIGAVAPNRGGGKG